MHIVISVVDLTKMMSKKSTNFLIPYLLGKIIWLYLQLSTGL